MIAGVILLMITHHRQSFYESTNELVDAQRARLGVLVGRKITGIWIASEPDGSWFNDEPAVICFGADQLEIAVYQIGLMAITWNTIDLSKSANWLGCWNDGKTTYPWIPASQEHFAACVNKTLHAIHAITGSHGLFGIQLTHDDGILVLYNALDELGVGGIEIYRDDNILVPVAG